MARLNYLELPVGEAGTAKRFYESVFGWRFTDYGPTYAATTSGDTDIGVQADPAEKTVAALPVIEVDDIEATLRAVESADGRSRNRSSPSPAVVVSTSATLTGTSLR